MAENTLVRIGGGFSGTQSIEFSLPSDRVLNAERRRNLGLQDACDSDEALLAVDEFAAMSNVLCPVEQCYCSRGLTTSALTARQLRDLGIDPRGDAILLLVPCEIPEASQEATAPAAEFDLQKRHRPRRLRKRRAGGESRRRAAREEVAGW